MGIFDKPLSAQAPGLLGQSWGDFTGRVNQVQQDNPEAFIALGAGLLNGDMAQGVAGMGKAIGDYRGDQRQADLQRQGWDRQDARFDKTFGLQQQQYDNQLAAQGTAKAQQAQQVNQTLKWAESTGDADVIGLAHAGMFPEAFKVYQAKKAPNGGGEYGLNLMYGTDANGNVVPMQPGKNGQAIRTAIPDGITPISPYDLNNQKAAGTAVGKGMGEQTVKAPSQIASTTQSIGLIDNILDDPGLSGITGVEANFPTVFSSSKDVEAKVDQLKGRAFGDSIQQMVGLGALSDAEGKAILQGAARLDPYQSDAGFRQSLMDLRNQVGMAQARAQAILSGNGGRVAAPPANSASPAMGGSAGQTSSGLKWSVR